MHKIVTGWGTVKKSSLAWNAGYLNNDNFEYISPKEHALAEELRWTRKELYYFPGNYKQKWS